MDYKEIRSEALRLYENYGDPEVSHGDEDDLLWKFIAKVAETESLSNDAKAAATALLMLYDTGYYSPNLRVRWYA